MWIPAFAGMTTPDRGGRGKSEIKEQKAKMMRLLGLKGRPRNDEF